LGKVTRNGDDTWKLFIGGQDAFFKQLFDIYYKELCDFGFRLCTDKELVRDSVQDIFVKIWTNRNGLQEVKSIRSYLFTALRNTLINHYNSPRSKTASLEDDVLPVFMLEYSPEELLIGRENDSENLRKVVAALNTLSARQKECIYLKYYSGLDYDDIAAIMGISVKACYKLSARAIAVLKDWAVNNNTSGGKPVYFWFL
jgi:RNA polymerase sigma factor (sigma-70 family)